MNVRVARNNLLGLLILSFLFLVGLSCNEKSKSFPPLKRFDFGTKEYSILPPEKSNPYDLSNVEMTTIPEEDKKKIAEFLGRVKGPDFVVQHIEVAWEDMPMTAIVRVRGRAGLILRRNDDGIWELVKSYTYDP